MLKIGIVGWKTGENSFGVTVPYFEYMSQYGEVQIISPNQYIDVDLLVLPGGLDVDVKRYSKKISLYSSNPNVILENFDENILPQYIANGTPIFGICRGLQTLNVCFGGTLKQDLKWHPYSDPRTELVHKITIVDEQLYNDIISKNNVKLKEKLSVNSMHHQAVDKLADCFNVMVVAYDNNVEAICHKTLAIAAIQWHCEEIYDKIAYNLITKILKRAEKI